MLALLTRWLKPSRPARKSKPRQGSIRGTHALCIAATLSGACASSAFSNGVFRRGDVAFAVGPVPEHWRLLDETTADADLAAFAFRDDLARVTIGAAGRCGRDGDDVPLRSLTQHLTIGFTDRVLESEAPLMLDGRAALRTEMTAKLDGVAKFLAFVVVKKDTCVYDFWRIADAQTDTSDFDRFVGGFRALD
jgi:hypothetical protein